MGERTPVSPLPIPPRGVPFRVVIPARYGSTRLPGKPLRLLAGRPLLEHVYRQARASSAQEVVIATDDVRIQEVAEKFGATVCMTSPDHASGTDRLAEVAQQRGWPGDAVVVNVQGDEPYLPPPLIDQVAYGLVTHPEAGIATLCTRLHCWSEVFDPHVVKVVRDAEEYALYFSRAPIPWQRTSSSASWQKQGPLPVTGSWFRHIGLYAYRAVVLTQYPRLSPAPMEVLEALEQVRALWHGIRIYVPEAAVAPPPGVDTEADLARAEGWAGSSAG